MSKKRNTTKRNARLEKAIDAVWGRPRIWDDPQEFDRECRIYIATLKWDAPSIEGITVHLGISRDTWERYRADKKSEIGKVIVIVETKMVAWWNTCLSRQGRAMGAQFKLKNFRPAEYKERGAGSDPDEPLHIKHITGMVIKRG